MNFLAVDFDNPAPLNTDSNALGAIPVNSRRRGAVFYDKPRAVFHNPLQQVRTVHPNADGERCR